MSEPWPPDEVSLALEALNGRITTADVVRRMLPGTPPLDRSKVPLGLVGIVSRESDFICAECFYRVTECVTLVAAKQIWLNTRGADVLRCCACRKRPLKDT